MNSNPVGLKVYFSLFTALCGNLPGARIPATARTWPGKHAQRRGDPHQGDQIGLTSISRPYGCVCHACEPCLRPYASVCLPMCAQKRLSREDWIMAAFRALTKAGPQALKVEPLARSLKVSKGSFYWHFKGISALKTAMIAHWQAVATAEISAEVTRTEQAPRAALSRLLVLTVSPRDAPYGGPETEAAIRDWGRYEAQVAEAMRAVDQQRVAFVAGLMRQYGLQIRLRVGKPRGLQRLQPDPRGA